MSNEQPNKEALKMVTPVANPTQLKSWSLRLILGMMAFGMLYILLVTSHKDKPKETPPQDTTTMPAINAKAPTLTLSDRDIEKLQTVIQTSPTVEEKSDNGDEIDKLNKMRMLAPPLVYSSDSSSTTNADTNRSNKDNSTSDTTTPLGGKESRDPNSQFMANVSTSVAPIATATHVAHPNYTLTQGTLLWATLETRIISDLPGMVSAVTSDDVYADDGTQLLLPKGSKLIGQYTSSVTQSQNRIFVVWQRAIRPDHIDIALNSPGTDPLGGTGINANGVDRHLLQQFGTAGLLSLIGAGAANSGVNANDAYNSTSAYRSALAGSFSQSAQNSLQATGVIKPTLYSNQGTKISVFVARDLDFYNELQTNHATQVF